MPAIKRHETAARPKTLAKFQSRIIKGNPDECWSWQGVRTPDNYGYMRQANMVNGKEESYINIFVHRLAYYINYGEIPTDMVVDHTCHNPKLCSGGKECEHRSCINPAHLTITTPLKNRVRSVMSSSVKGKCRNNLHEWNEANVQTLGSGKKVCISCKKAQAERARLRKAGV